MPVSSKAQEPSIDEILDSIRRIIADEDLAIDIVGEVSQAYAPAPPVQSSARLRPAVQPVRREGEDLPSVASAGRPRALNTERAGRYAPVAVTQSEPAVAEPRYRSADEAAPVMRPVRPPVREPEPRRQSVQAQKPARDGSRAEEYAVEAPSLAGNAKMSEPRQANNALPRQGDDPMDHSAPPVSGQNANLRPRAAAVAPRVTDPHVSEGRAPLPRRDLLSPAVDAAVTAAFQSLGDLVLPQHERTVEDLVKEILRPMLKEWLDQNLAGIVERLVRAEIERVTGNIR